jgi:uncharacterized membrane protein
MEAARETAEDLMHPGLALHLSQRSKNPQDRIADAITNFAGSMPFVYVHIIWFSLWIILKVEAYPFGLLTMIVSLEAIFLSTFVMISQNRQDEARKALANQEYQMVLREEDQNEKLIELSNQILNLTKEVHALVRRQAPGAS